MAIDDVVAPEMAIAVGATALVFSPPVRRLLRRGAVYALVGGLLARDAVVALGRGMSSGAQQATAAAGAGVAGARRAATETPPVEGGD